MSQQALREPDDIDPVLMRACLWAGIILVAATVVGLVGLVGFIPPPSPAMPAQTLLAYIQGRQNLVLAGGALLTFCWSLWIFWVAPIIIYIRRMERAPLLTYASLVNVGGGSAVIIVIAVAWTLMGFRANDANTVQLFADFGFFMFLYTWPAFGFWMFTVAAAILRNVRAEAVWPRWVAYYNIYCGILMFPASLMGLFKTGPFAYNGILAFWLVSIDFFSWMLVMTIVTFQAVAKDERRLRGNS